MIAKTHPELSVREAVLFVAFELSRREWKLALTSGFGVRRGCARSRRGISRGWRA